MIAIATGKKDVDESLKEYLKDSEILESVESLYEDSLKFDTVVISKHLKATEMIISELLLFLKQSNRRIIYITNEDEADEIKMCLKFDIRDIMFEPVDVYKIRRITEGKAELYNNKTDINAEDSLFGFYEDLYENETAQGFKNSIHPFDKGLYENEEPKGVEEAEEIKKVVAEKENNKAEVVKSSNANNLTNNTVAIPVVQAIKRENIFVFTLNYIYKLLSLFVNLIAPLLENVYSIVASFILTAAVAYGASKGEIDIIDFIDTLVKMIKAYFKLG